MYIKLCKFRTYYIILYFIYSILYHIYEMKTIAMLHTINIIYNTSIT